MKDLNNSTAIFDATDKKLEASALSNAKGDLARIQFMADATEAFVNQTLRAKQPKGKRKINEGDFAEYAIDLWNTRRAAMLSEQKGKHVAVRAAEPSRKSDLRFIFRATVQRPDIVTAAWGICNTLDEANKKRTYDAIVAAAKAQVADLKRKLSDTDLRNAMAPKESVTDEGKSLDAVVKKLTKMAEEFPAHAAEYTKAANALAPIVALLQGDHARDRFFADAIKNGFSKEAALAFWQSKENKKAA